MFAPKEFLYSTILLLVKFMCEQVAGVHALFFAEGIEIYKMFSVHDCAFLFV